MEGLCSFLIPFSDLVKDNQQTLANFFKYVMSGIVATKDATRYDVPLAGFFYIYLFIFFFDFDKKKCLLV